MVTIQQCVFCNRTCRAWFGGDYYTHGWQKSDGRCKACRTLLAEMKRKKRQQRDMREVPPVPCIQCGQHPAWDNPWLTADDYGIDEEIFQRLNNYVIKRGLCYECKIDRENWRSRFFSCGDLCSIL
jgi:hypothetical protein